MLFRTFLTARRNGVLALLALGIIIGGLEGAFVLLLKGSLSGGPLRMPWPVLLAAAFALVTFRTLAQWGAARRETSLVYGFVAQRRDELLRLAAARRFPVYRDPWRSSLTEVFDRGLTDLADGLAAALRCGSALVQVAVLLPLLLLFSWKPALAALALALPALWISRLRAGSLRAASARHGASAEALDRAVEGFADGLEGSAGNGRLAEACAALSGERARHERAAESWELSKALFPPLLEWLFFAALAGLLVVAATARSGAEWTASLLPFAALLLLLHRPIREWARHHPARLPGDRAWASYRNLYATLQALPAPEPAPPASGRSIRLEGVRFSYLPADAALPGRADVQQGGAPVFAHLEVELDPESVTWVPGPNGSGKSTFLKLLAGLETPQAGAIRLPERLREAPRAFAYLPQRAVIEPDWLEWARVFSGEHADDWRALEEILALPDLIARAKPERPEQRGSRSVRDWAGSLSGGQRQRLALARVFASEAPCLLLDEPTTWLASGDRERIMGDLLSFRKRKPGQGAVLVSHEPFLGEFAARTLRLEAADDRKARQGRPAEPRA